VHDIFSLLLYFFFSFFLIQSVNEFISEFAIATCALERHSPEHNKRVVYDRWHFLFGDRLNTPRAILLILIVGAYSTVFDQQYFDNPLSYKEIINPYDTYMESSIGVHHLGFS